MRRLLALVVVALALTACKVDATVDVAVKADGTGVITLTAVADADVVAQAPGLAEDLRFDDAIAAGWVLTPPAATDTGGLQVVLTHEFATVEEATALLQSINGAGGPLHDVVLTRAVTAIEHDEPNTDKSEFIGRKISYGSQISTDGIINSFYTSSRGHKGGGYPKLPAADFARLSKLLKELPDDGGILPGHGGE